MNERNEEWAVFWCSLLREAIFRDEDDPRGTNRILREIAARTVVFPDGRPRRPSLSSLRRKYRTYRTKGFDALIRKARADRGKPRGHDPETIARAIEIKRDDPYRSPLIINQFLKAEQRHLIPRSTLLRLLKAAGATRIRLDAVKMPVRKRWTRDHTHDLWVGDFSEGPYVRYDGGLAEPTQLSAFIDAHSRFVPAARYYTNQTLDILVDTLLKGWAAHGLPKELYVDNAQVYHALALKAACFRLNIRLIHRTPGDPPPGGLVERFFQTVQMQFERAVRSGEILTLDELNRRFSAWLEMSYHRTPNTETKESPKDRCQAGLLAVRRVDMNEAVRAFMRTCTRRVNKDFSDVSLNNLLYRVDRRFRGEKVVVRYDIFSPLETVEIYSLREEYLGMGTRHRREEGEEVPRTAPGKPRNNYLDMIVRQHEEELKKETCAIDYRKAALRQGWPFPSFVRVFARLLGMKGGLSGFTAGELEDLGKAFNRLPLLDEPLLKRAFEKAHAKNIPAVVTALFELTRKES